MGQSPFEKLPLEMRTVVPLGLARMALRIHSGATTAVSVSLRSPSFSLDALEDSLQSFCICASTHPNASIT
jgi:hypothetical protein